MFGEGTGDHWFFNVDFGPNMKLELQEFFNHQSTFGSESFLYEINCILLKKNKIKTRSIKSNSLEKNQCWKIKFRVIFNAFSEHEVRTSEFFQPSINV